MKTALVMMAAVVLVLITGLFVTHAFAHPPGWGRHGGRNAWLGCGHLRHGGAHHGKKIMRLVSQLDLTDKQSDEVREIFKSHMEQFIDVMWKIARAKRELSRGFDDDVADERAIRAAADRLGDAISQAAVLRSDLPRQISEVLTPEQMEQLKDLQTRNPHSECFSPCGGVPRDRQEGHDHGHDR